MAHDLTESDAFTTPVAVPDGIDTHNTAANVVQAIAQALANRTKYLKARYDTNTGKLDDDNVFVHTQYIDTVDNEEAMISSNLASPVAGFPDSAWRLFASFIIGGSRRVRIYFGQNDSDSEGAFCITVNALYSTNTANSWYADDAAFPSYAMFMHELRLRTAVKSNSDLSWDWALRGALEVGDVDAKSVSSLGTVTAATDVTAGDEYLYGSTHLRTQPIHLADCYGGLKRGTLGDVFIDITLPDPLQKVAWPVRLPVGAVMGNIEVIGFQSTTDQILVTLQTRTHNFASPNAPAMGAPATTLGPASIGYHKMTLSTAGIVVLPGVEYAVTFTTNSGLSPGVANDYITALRMVNWEDPGPLNHL